MVVSMELPVYWLQPAISPHERRHLDVFRRYGHRSGFLGFFNRLVLGRKLAK